MRKQEELKDDVKYVKVPEALYYELLSETEQKEKAYHEKVVVPVTASVAAPSHPKAAAAAIAHHDTPPQHHETPKHKETVKH